MLRGTTHLCPNKRAGTTARMGVLEGSGPKTSNASASREQVERLVRRCRAKCSEGDLMHVGFWDAHTFDWLVLFGLAVFPRITLLFIGGPFFLLEWVGWLICPHLLVAVLATTTYWDTDPLLCIAAWFFAFAGTGGEGKVVHYRTRRRRRRDDE